MPKPGQAVGMAPKSHSCVMCSQSFVHKESLVTHIMLQHNDVSAFECNVCFKVFESQSLMKSHKDTCVLKGESGREVSENGEAHEGGNDLGGNDLGGNDHSGNNQSGKYCGGNHGKYDLGTNDQGANDQGANDQGANDQSAYYQGAFENCIFNNESTEDHVTINCVGEGCVPNITLVKDEEFLKAPEYILPNTKSAPATPENNTDPLAIVKRDPEDQALDTKYPCPSCPLRFSRRDSQQIHMKTVHLGLKEHVCLQCGHAFGQRSSMLRHVNSVHEHAKQFRCEYCAREFYRRDKLHSHLQRCDQAKNEVKLEPDTKDSLDRKCPEYPKVFYIDTHLRALEKKYPCPSCPLRFSRRDNHQIHVKTVHLGLKEHVCLQCGRAFSQRSSMLRHMNSIHEHTKQFRCEYCAREFYRRYEFNSHLQRCGQAKNEVDLEPGTKDSLGRKCPECPKVFYIDTHLKAHKRRNHGREKQFPCSSCPQRFTLRHSLQNHVKTVHEGVKAHVCEQCGRAFGQRTTMLRHVKSVHDELKEAKCVLCAKKFTRKYHLKMHFERLHTGI